MPPANISNTQASSTYSETDENDLELCIRNWQEEIMSQNSENLRQSYKYGQTVTFRFRDSGEDYDDDDDTPVTDKSGIKRASGSGSGPKGKGPLHGREGIEGSRTSKKGKKEASNVQETLSLIQFVQEVRMATYPKKPVERATEILVQMNLDNEVFFKAFAWIIQSRHNASMFLGLSDGMRRKWIESLL